MHAEPEDSAASGCPHKLPSAAVTGIRHPGLRPSHPPTIPGGAILLNESRLETHHGLHGQFVPDEWLWDCSEHRERVAGNKDLLDQRPDTLVGALPGTRSSITVQTLAEIDRMVSAIACTSSSPRAQRSRSTSGVGGSWSPHSD